MGFQVSGAEIGVNTSRLVRGRTSNGIPYAIFSISVPAGASPGMRNLYLTGPAEQAALTGAIEVRGS
jgi:hypothetical protein